MKPAQNGQYWQHHAVAISALQPITVTLVKFSSKVRCAGALLMLMIMSLCQCICMVPDGAAADVDGVSVAGDI
jgi:hypothetical protein